MSVGLLIHHPQPLNLLKPFNGPSQVLAVQQGNQSGERFFGIARGPGSRYSPMIWPAKRNVEITRS